MDGYLLATWQLLDFSQLYCCKEEGYTTHGRHFFIAWENVDSFVVHR